MIQLPTPPAEVLEVARYVAAEEDPSTLTMAAKGFPVHRVTSGHATDVWVGSQWVIKRWRSALAGEDARWRRSARDVEAFYADRIRHGDWRHVPVTVAVSDTVVVQERFDPNPIRFTAHQQVVDSVGKQFRLSNLSCDNVGWRGRTPVFIDVEYKGPDLTVVLLLKKPRGRTWQGELPFWAEWGPTYLQRMVRNVRRHLPSETRIVVMTDWPDVVPPGCDVAILTEDHPGWWSKLWMFRREVTSGRCLYLDLDNVVCGPMRELLALTPDPMIMMDDRHRPGMPNASTMLFFAERVRYLWDEYAQDPEGWRARFPETAWPNASDQAYTTYQLLQHEGRYMPYFQDLLGEGYALNSRTELEMGVPWDRAQLVYGCWEPKIHQSKHALYLSHWYDDS